MQSTSHEKAVSFSALPSTLLLVALKTALFCFALTVHRSTESSSHDIKKIPHIGFDTAEDDPTVLVAEVSSHGSHECDL